MKRVMSVLTQRVSLGLLAHLLLIYVIMDSVLLGAELVVRGTSAAVLQLLVVLGIGTGWVLGRSHLKTWAVLLIDLAAGLLATAFHIGGIDAALLGLLSSALAAAWGWAFRGGGFDPTQLNLLLDVMQTRFRDLAFNLSQWVNDLLTGFSVYNQISTLLTWGFLLWLLSSWIAWVTRRRDQPIWGILPAGVVLAILMTYTLERRILLVFLLGAGLILVGLVNHLVKQREWRANGIKGADNVRDRMLLAIVGVSLSTVIFAGLMPSIRIKAIADPVENWIYGEGEAGGEDSGGGIEVGGFTSELYSVERFAGLPRQKLIGSGPELAKRVVMIVKYPTTSFIRSDLPNAARYWRAYTYDRYTGNGWQSSPTVEIEYRPGQEIVEIQRDNFEIITQEIRLSNILRGTLYSAGPPVTIDQDGLVSWRTVRNEELNGESQIVVVDDLFAVTLDQIHYQVRSLVPTLADEQLRQTTGEVPAWVQDRYLELPDNLPQRVRDLAQEIVANRPTPYDQAKALEAFLRRYPYTLDLPEPPANQDIADYFLFDLQTGYCDYYATAMVVLARTVGLPARVVVGYVGGQYDQENDQYLVTEADAHTWAEIYLAGYGWIPFEPTAARSLIDEEELALPLPPELEQPPLVQRAPEKASFPAWEMGLGGVFVAVLGIWVGSRADWARLKSMDATGLSLVLYGRLYRYGRWLGLGHLRSDTIFEFEKKLTSGLRSLLDSAARERVLLLGISEISQLTHLAVRANYSSAALQPRDKIKLLEIWKNLRGRLRLAIWFSVLRTARKKTFSLGRRLDDESYLTNGAADG